MVSWNLLSSCARTSAPGASDARPGKRDRSGRTEPSDGRSPPPDQALDAGRRRRTRAPCRRCGAPWRLESEGRAPLEVENAIADVPELSRGFRPGGASERPGAPDSRMFSTPQRSAVPGRNFTYISGSPEARRGVEGAGNGASGLAEPVRKLEEHIGDRLPVGSEVRHQVERPERGDEERRERRQVAHPVLAPGRDLEQ